MSTKGAEQQPARVSERMLHMDYGEFEARAFALKRDKRRRRRELAKFARKRNRK